MIRLVALFFLILLQAFSYSSCKSVNKRVDAGASLKADGVPRDFRDYKKYAPLIETIKNGLQSPITLGKCEVEFFEHDTGSYEDGEWYKISKHIKIKFADKRFPYDHLYVYLNGADKLYEGGVFAKNGNIIIENSLIDMPQNKNQKIIVEFNNSKYEKITQISMQGWYWKSGYADKNEEFWKRTVNEKCVEE